jgi:hypothetical protein
VITNESGYVMTVDMAEPRDPDTAWPSAGRAGPPSNDVFVPSSCSLCQSSKASYC